MKNGFSADSILDLFAITATIALVTVVLSRGSDFAKATNAIGNLWTGSLATAMGNRK
jgi:hypothetical protein